MVCPTCGERNPDGARFCLNCGVPLVRPALGANPWLGEIDAIGDARAAVT